jgi:hypothetical protein
MKAIGVLNTHPHLEADLVIKSMQDLTWEMIESVMRET